MISHETKIFYLYSCGTSHVWLLMPPLKTDWMLRNIIRHQHPTLIICIICPLWISQTFDLIGMSIRRYLSSANDNQTLNASNKCIFIYIWCICVYVQVDLSDWTYTKFRCEMANPCHGSLFATDITNGFSKETVILITLVSFAKWEVISHRVIFFSVIIKHIPIKRNAAKRLLV